MARGKHERKYLDELHRRERRRNILWGGALAVVIIIGAGAIISSALSPRPGSSSEQQRVESSETSSAALSSSATQSSSEAASSDSSSTEKKSTRAEKAATSEDAASTSSASFSGVTICIDPGHCANPDSTPSPNNPDASLSENIATEPGGTSGSLSGPEYKICMLVAKQLEKDYEAAGAKVVMVRTKDDVSPISPKNRALIANKAKADAFVRLHCDSAGSQTSGFYTLVPADTGYQGHDSLYKKSQQMGRFMHKRIVKSLKAHDRGVTVRSDQGGFNWCKVPCVLFEMANMDNASDDKKLATASYRAKLASSICDATVAWFER